MVRMEPAETGGVAMFPVAIRAPEAHRVDLCLDGVLEDRVELRADGNGAWVGEVAEGSRYVVLVDGERPALDPRATEVWFPDGHSRTANKPGGTVSVETFPRAVATPWPTPRPQRWTTRPLVVYEAHVRGLTKCRDRAGAGTYGALVDELPRLAGIGVSVLELLPIHQFDPDEGNYWGYMPLVFGAVHCEYASGEHPADELAAVVAAAHDHDLEVWLDIVVNHTTEEDAIGPSYTLRILDDHGGYARRDDGEYLDDSGTGNTVDACSPPAQQLIMESLNRLADLGVDGFRFDLAAVLARDPEFVRAIGDWGERRGVRLIAEPWDLARYLLGSGFPDARWAQWNGKFRDDLRGFLRAEPGLVPVVAQRVAGSLDLFDSPARSVNFLTAHDGFTMYDLVAYDQRHNLANGWGGTDGHGDNRSWNCGWEGDVDAPEDVLTLRRRQTRNAMSLLLLSRGVPMFVAGDEFARTQHGNNNAYNQDNETSWIDWSRSTEFAGHETFVRALIAVRAAHPALSDPARWNEPMRTFGTRGEPDLSFESRTLAWNVDGLYVIANMWWEPLEFEVQVAAPWRRTIDTSNESGRGDGSLVAGPIVVGPRSIVALTM